MMRKSEMKNVFNVQTVEPNGQHTHICDVHLAPSPGKTLTIGKDGVKPSK